MVLAAAGHSLWICRRGGYRVGRCQEPVMPRGIRGTVHGQNPRTGAHRHRAKYLLRTARPDHSANRDYRAPQRNPTLAKAE